MDLLRSSVWRFRGRRISNRSKELNVSHPSFQDLGASEPVVRALAKRSISSPFVVQALVLPDAIAGLDVLARSPTGSGKTLAFGIPIVERTARDDRRPAALILVPTRELAVQVAEELEPIAAVKGLGVAAVYGGVAISVQAKRAASAHILVATPGRLQDLVERKLVKLDRVRILILDEADRMLDMGFKPQVDRIVQRLPRNRQTMFFSATLDGEVGELARAYTSNAVRVEGTLPAQAELGDVEHRFVPVTVDTKIDTLVEHLKASEGLTLVFVRTKRGADRLARKLVQQGIAAGAMHGDMAQRARERTLARFEAGKITALVATDVAARGLDLDDITGVINYDPPEDDKGYVHRVGRTGRAGRDGTGVTFVLPEQQADLSRVAARLGHAEAFAVEGMRVAPARLVYSSRRGRSKWGPSRPRRKI
jgi:ATP-dependent RNA helicase RhlE